jgi:hypothetical protein
MFAQTARLVVQVRCLGALVVELNGVNAYRPRDVLQLLLAEVDKGELEFAEGVFLDPRRRANAVQLGQLFKTRRNVHTIAEDVAILHDNVALMDANTEVDAPISGLIGIAFGHLALHLDSTAQRLDELPDSTSRPSPVVLTMRPRCSEMAGSITSRRVIRSAPSVPSSFSPISRE